MFVPALEVVGDPAASTQVLFVHGILGSGRNWRSFARRIANEWGDAAGLLVDLRGHGDSNDAPGPHTVEACAADLAEAIAAHGTEPTWVCGHSFGGKVATRYAQDYAASLEHLWLLDAPLRISETGDVEAVVEAVSKVPLPISKRDELVSELTGQGFSTMLARWMTTNLERAADGLRWRFELPVIRDLLRDYRALDLCGVLEAPPSGVSVHAVIGGESDRFPARDRADLEAAARRGAITLDVLEGAGHWLHADDPDGLFQLLASRR
jgi:pimeloyl-ACP methyl ester carboxylesterase